MKVAVFCRVNHPAGYGGFPDVPGYAPRAARDWYENATRNKLTTNTGAHGYVTLLVRCRDSDQIKEVATRLGQWFQWDRRTDLWYGGTFDLVAVINGDPVDIAPKWLSYGDNRACAVLDALDVLSQPVDDTWRT